MPQLYRLTKTVEVQLRTRMDIREDDQGSFHGTLMFVDERDNVIESRPLLPEELDLIVGGVLGTKDEILQAVGAERIEIADPIAIDEPVSLDVKNR